MNVNSTNSPPTVMAGRCEVDRQACLPLIALILILSLAVILTFYFYQGMPWNQRFIAVIVGSVTGGISLILFLILAIGQRRISPDKFEEIFFENKFSISESSFKEVLSQDITKSKFSIFVHRNVAQASMVWMTGNNDNLLNKQFKNSKEQFVRPFSNPGPNLFIVLPDKGGFLDRATGDKNFESQAWSTAGNKYYLMSQEEERELHATGKLPRALKHLIETGDYSE